MISEDDLPPQKPRDIKKPGRVERLLPALADGIIFFLQIVIAGGFCYFAYFYKNRGDTLCWANDYSDYPLPICDGC